MVLFNLKFVIQLNGHLDGKSLTVSYAIIAPDIGFSFSSLTNEPLRCWMSMVFTLAPLIASFGRDDNDNSD